MPLPDEDTTQTETEAKETNDATENPEQTEEQPKEPPEGGDTESPDAKAQETEGEPAKGEDDKGEDAEPEEKRKRAGGWQRKIERLERQNQLLVEQLSTQRPNQQSTTQPLKEQTPQEQATAYIDSMVERGIAKREAEREQKAALAELRRRTAVVRAARPDFDDVVSSVDIPTDSAIGQALLTSEHGAEMLYRLAADPDELARISALPPIAAAREIGRLEAKLTSVAPPPKTQGTAKRPPAPPTTVKGSTSNTRSLEDLPISEYKRAYRSGRR